MYFAKRRAQNVSLLWWGNWKQTCQWRSWAQIWHCSHTNKDSQDWLCVQVSHVLILHTMYWRVESSGNVWGTRGTWNDKQKQSYSIYSKAVLDQDPVPIFIRTTLLYHMLKWYNSMTLVRLTMYLLQVCIVIVDVTAIYYLFKTVRNNMVLL